jgi:GGDEF domain-containing protein
MTRLEVFSDAAFAFAVTTLVVTSGEIPGTYEELILALKKVPSFILSFAQIMVFWITHRLWSQRYGLEDFWTTFLSMIKLVAERICQKIADHEFFVGSKIEKAVASVGLSEVSEDNLKSIIQKLELKHYQATKQPNSSVVSE